MENESVVLVANRDTQCFEPMKWEDLHVGDIVKVLKNHPIPADLYLMAAFEKNQETEMVSKVEQCYVQTKNLDGETNLKLKQTLPQVSSVCFPLSKSFNNHSYGEIMNFQADISCEEPSNNIYKFDGVIKVPKYLFDGAASLYSTTNQF